QCRTWRWRQRVHRNERLVCSPCMDPTPPTKGVDAALRCPMVSAMSLPTGTITFLFTDIEGSTQLWEQHPDAMRLALARHDAFLRAAIETNNGHVFKTMGDAFCAAFPVAADAVDAALAIQQSLRSLQPSAVAASAEL